MGGEIEAPSEALFRVTVLRMRGRFELPHCDDVAAMMQRARGTDLLLIDVADATLDEAVWAQIVRPDRADYGGIRPQIRVSGAKENSRAEQLNQHARLAFLERVTVPEPAKIRGVQWEEFDLEASGTHVVQSKSVTVFPAPEK